jgi:hypothetical protein
MAKGSSYVVRGAKIQCNCGSHKRKINLLVSHGGYVNGKPIMNETDTKINDNITYLGICKNGKNPCNETICLVTEKGQTIQGKKCCPKFISTWMKVKEDTKIDGKPVLTSESQLTCAYGGKITFVSDGQKED